MVVPTLYDKHVRFERPAQFHGAQRFYLLLQPRFHDAPFRPLTTKLMKKLEKKVAGGKYNANTGIHTTTPMLVMNDHTIYIYEVCIYPGTYTVRNYCGINITGAKED